MQDQNKNRSCVCQRHRDELGYTVKPIWISMIAEDRSLPAHMDALWASVSNKSKLQMFLRKDMIKNAENTCPEEVEAVFI